MMSKIQPDLPTDRERTLWSVFHRVSPGKWIALYFVARATSFATGCSDPHAAGTLGNKCIQSCDSPHCDEGLSCKESSYDAVSDGVRAPPEIRRRCRTPSVVRYKSPSSAAKRFRSRPTRAAMRAQNDFSVRSVLIGQAPRYADASFTQLCCAANGSMRESDHALRSTTACVRFPCRCVRSLVEFVPASCRRSDSRPDAAIAPNRHCCSPSARGRRRKARGVERSCRCRRAPTGA